MGVFRESFGNWWGLFRRDESRLCRVSHICIDFFRTMPNADEAWICAQLLIVMSSKALLYEYRVSLMLLFTLSTTFCMF